MYKGTVSHEASDVGAVVKLTVTKCGNSLACWPKATAYHHNLPVLLYTPDNIRWSYI